MLKRNISHLPFEICRFFKRFVDNVILLNQEWLKLGVALFCKKREYSATTSDDRFHFSQNDDNFNELPKGFQTNNTKLSNCWALTTYSKWAKVCGEHIHELTLMEIDSLIVVYTKKKEQQTLGLSCHSGPK